MAYSKTSLTLALALAMGAMACGGSDQNAPPPQTPANTTTTTAGYGANPSPAAPSTTGYGQSGNDVNATGTSTSGTVTGSATSDTSNTGSQQATGMGQPNGATGTGTAGATSMGSSSSNDVTLTDAQISGVTGAANTAEIDQAREAMKKAKNAKVKQFAQHMITDHTQMATKGKQLDKKAGLTPQDSDVSNQLKSSASQIATTLKSSTGADFDRAYIDAQVTEHQQVLDLLDQKLIPQAQNQELKTALQGARDKVADHLKMAKDIQASLTK